VIMWGGISNFAVGIVATMGSSGPIPGAWAAQPAPTSTTTPPSEIPLENVAGYQALWFIGALALVVALLWAVPLIYDTREANRWRREDQARLLNNMINRAGRLSVEEIRQIVSAIDTQPRGTQGLTQSLLGLIVATFVGVALIATLVSTAADSSDLRKTIITALLSILGTIAGFYFGARTAQTAAEQATRPPEARPPRPDAGGGVPRVLSITPNTGAPGVSVAVTGSGFRGASAVMFGDVAAESFTVDSDEKITVPSPAGSGTVVVAVTTPAGTSVGSEAAKFTYSPEASGPAESPPAANATDTA
jgi:IPT/TIG domain-containing protein